jgi:HEPN domain-containing protein
MNLPWIENPFRLWSLEDMLKFNAVHYLLIAQNIAHINDLFATNKMANLDSETFREVLKGMKEYCEELGLKISTSHLSNSVNDLPQNAREWRIIDRTIREEISSHLFLFVPPHRASYYQRNESPTLSAEFPKSSREIVHAGNCFATGEYTACVFHCMRAVELGLRSMAIDLGVSLSHPIELAEWKTLIDQIEIKIKDMHKLPKSEEKNKNITFYSDAASQFRYFKDAYRHHVAHAREIYEEDQAKSIMDRTREFLEGLATRIKEPE